MTRNSEIARAVRRTLVMSAVATAGITSMQAQAQDQAQQEVQTVTVTGSRIPQPTLTSISPVTAVNAAEIKESGATRTEDLINNLPQVAADFGGNVSNGATGASTVSLRGLGANRTLVLVNGRRLMPGDPTQNGNAAPDLNQIPAALVERVEVLTGGASAVYGADAVAGVVNFVMNDHFEGIRVDAQYSMYSHKNDNGVASKVSDSNFLLPKNNVTDGDGRDFTVVLGGNTADGKGNATAYLGFRKLNTITQAERDFSACSFGSGDELECAGSSTGASGAGSMTRFITFPNAAGIDANDYTIDNNGALAPFGTTDNLYNFAPFNFYQRPDERKTAGLFAHYDVNEHFTAYTELSFMDDRTDAQIAPSGIFLSGSIVNCDNPLLSAEQVQAFCTDMGYGPTDNANVIIGRRNVEGGGRVADLRHTSYRGLLGAKGAINDAWSYDVYGLYGTTVYNQLYLNELSLRKSANALLVRPDPDTGVPTCEATLSGNDPNCVPYNVFAPNAVTQEALDYIQSPGLQEGDTRELVVSGSVTADLGQYGWRSPWATDGIGFALGAERRTEASELRNDEAFLTGDLAGQGGATLDTNGSYGVTEGFTEIRVPITQDKPFAQSISFEAGYRYSDYSLGFNTDTYKLGLDWAPVEDIRFRGSYQRAVRAPNIQELFRPNVVQLDGNTDPCAGATPSATAEQCALTGVTPGQYGSILANSASQYNGLTGGNPNLDPESADTYSFGFVLTPRVAPNFTMAVDYYDIKIKKFINQLGADAIINNCLSSGDPTFCSLISRAPVTGSLWLGTSGFIIDTYLNSGSQSTKGIDVDASYRFDIGAAGRLGLSFIGTYVDSLETQLLPGGSAYDCVGLYGTVCGVPTPKWRNKMRITWSSPWNLDATLTWRFTDSVDLDHTSSAPDLTGDVPASDAKLGSRSYVDLYASYDLARFGGVLSKTQVRLGINNLTDKDPPLVGLDNATNVFASGNTFPQVYDTMGRYLFLGVTADF